MARFFRYEIVTDSDAFVLAWRLNGYKIVEDLRLKIEVRMLLRLRCNVKLGASDWDVDDAGKVFDEMPLKEKKTAARHYF